MFDYFNTAFYLIQFYYFLHRRTECFEFSENLFEKKKKLIKKKKEKWNNITTFCLQKKKKNTKQRNNISSLFKKSFKFI